MSAAVPERLEPRFDPEDHKRKARRGWSLAADGWRNWWRTFEDAAQPLNERLVDLARIVPGMRVLDVATGIGEPALTAARRVGARGTVLATDLSPRMIELGAERARELGLANVTFAEADAERLALDLPGFEPASFDAALSRWGLMLMPGPDAALAGIRAALRPDARLACAVWAVPERAPFLVLGREEAARALGVPPAHPDVPGPFRLAEDGALTGLLERSGMRVELEERFEVRFAFESVERYADFVFELSSQLGEALAKADASTRIRAREALVAAAGGAASADGALVLANEVVCAVARR